MSLVFLCAIGCFVNVNINLNISDGGCADLHLRVNIWFFAFYSVVGETHKCRISNFILNMIIINVFSKMLSIDAFPKRWLIVSIASLQNIQSIDSIILLLNEWYFGKWNYIERLSLAISSKFERCNFIFLQICIVFKIQIVLPFIFFFFFICHFCYLYNFW